MGEIMTKVNDGITDLRVSEINPQVCKDAKIEQENCANTIPFPSLSAQDPGRQPVRDEEDDRAGPARRRAAHGQRVAAQVRAAGGAGQPPLLRPHARTDHHFHCASGERSDTQGCGRRRRSFQARLKCRNSRPPIMLRAIAKLLDPECG